ncbi:hypothetical protein GEMRC1_013526 [Eukaryota sp. GEM-RC1]
MCQSWLASVSESSLTFVVELIQVGNCHLIGSSFSNIFNLNLSLEVGNFLIIPPKVNFNSRIQFILTENISDLFVTHGNQTISVNNGVNILNLNDSSTFITLHKQSQSMNVSFVSSLFDSEILEVIEVLVLQSFVIDLDRLQSEIDVTCDGDCDLVEYTESSILYISFVATEPGFTSLDFSTYYLNSSFYFRLPISVYVHPVFELVSPNIVSGSSNDFLLLIHGYSHFDISNSIFLISNSIIQPTTVELISSFDSFFVFRFGLNLSSLPVFEGEYVQNLYWSQMGFNKRFISEILFFNLQFSSYDHVSVFEHRDISVDFQGILTSNLTCFIEDQNFFGLVVDNLLFARMSEFQLSKNIFLLNSFEISGEAFLEEICFSSYPHHPLVNSSDIISNTTTYLIFDGSRCCSVDVSFCSHFIYRNELLLFQFISNYDIHIVIITTNSSCEGIVSDFPFELIVNNQTLSSFVYCKQIPSGYSFASMCEIDLVLPKTSDFTLVALEDLYLLEVEFYGYKSDTCFTPFAFWKGVTSLGEVIDEDVHLKYHSRSIYSMADFHQLVVDQSTFWSSSFLTFPTELYSHHCYHSTVNYPTVLTASSATSVVFVAQEVELNHQHLNIYIPIICVDPLNFIVDCSGMFSVKSSTFEFLTFNLKVII